MFMEHGFHGFCGKHDSTHPTGRIVSLRKSLLALVGSLAINAFNGSIS